MLLQHGFIMYSVPASAPSNLTVISKTARTISLEWTRLNDADGYVVYVTNDTDTVQRAQFVGNCRNSITVTGLRGSTTYNITVRAYQQLVGPASNTITVETLELSKCITNFCNTSHTFSHPNSGLCHHST